MRSLCWSRPSSFRAVRLVAAADSRLKSSAERLMERSSGSDATPSKAPARRPPSCVNSRRICREMKPDDLFADYPVARPITIDSIHGGHWQGMVCDRCTCAGYFELLPGDDLDFWQCRFAREVALRLQSRGVQSRTRANSVRRRISGTSLGSEPRPLSVRRGGVAACQSPEHFSWTGFNSGCEAGLRANRTQTPTLVWGPGSLAQAHTVDEYVAWADVRRVADAFTQLIDQWGRRLNDV